MTVESVVVIPTAVRAAIPEVNRKFKDAILALSEPCQALPHITAGVYDAVAEAGLAHDAALCGVLANMVGLRELADLVAMVKLLVLAAETRIPGPLPAEFDRLMCRHFSRNGWPPARDGSIRASCSPGRMAASCTPTPSHNPSSAT